MWGNDGAKLCDDGAKLRVGAGEKLREGEGATRTGAMLRGSTRTRAGALARGSLDHEEADGALRRTLSPVKAWRALAGARGELL